MLNRGWMTVCVLIAGMMIAVAAVPVLAQATTQPASPGDAAPGASELQPIPQDDGAQPAATSADGNTTTKPTTQPANGKGSAPGFGDPIFLVLIGGVILMWIFMGRGRRKEQARRRDMLSNLKKGDKIQTIGGIIGTVIEVRAEEVTVKVDETNNVRMKFSRRAIHQIGGDAKAENDKDKK